MSLIQAVFMGIIQGITEFIPVSSSGHLVLLEQAFQIETHYGFLFETLLHLGTLLAIVIVFQQDLKRLTAEGLCMIRDIKFNSRAWIKNKKEQEAIRYQKIVSSNYRQFLILLIVSTIPTAVIGLILRDLAMKARNSMLATGIGLFCTGVMLLVAHFMPNGNKVPKDVKIHDALIIGICQGIAVFPGVSRCGMTIAAALLCGLNRKFAIKYSFILSIPVIIGAVFMEITKVGGSAFKISYIFYYLTGMVTAALVGYISIRLMLKLIRKQPFKVFSMYCFFIGTFAMIGYFVL